MKTRIYAAPAVKGLRTIISLNLCKYTVLFNAGSVSGRFFVTNSAECCAKQTGSTYCLLRKKQLLPFGFALRLTATNVHWCPLTCMYAVYDVIELLSARLTKQRTFWGTQNYQILRDAAGTAAIDLLLPS